MGQPSHDADDDDLCTEISVRYSGGGKTSERFSGSALDSYHIRGAFLIGFDCIVRMVSSAYRTVCWSSVDGIGTGAAAVNVNVMYRTVRNLWKMYSRTSNYWVAWFGRVESHDSRQSVGWGSANWGIVQNISYETIFKLFKTSIIVIELLHKFVWLCFRQHYNYHSVQRMDDLKFFSSDKYRYPTNSQMYNVNNCEWKG